VAGYRKDLIVWNLITKEKDNCLLEACKSEIYDLAKLNNNSFASSSFDKSIKI
jgi:hypothetical protein